MTDNADTEVAEPDHDVGEEGDEEARAPGLDPEILQRRDAALAHVVKFGDPVLRSKASLVTDFGPALREEAGRMIAIMSDGLGVGLAATQLGILRRVLVFQASADSDPTVFVNPELDWLSDELALAEEGCLSLPKVSMDVDRPLYARMHGVDLEGKPLAIEAAGLEARVLQHELDHLDGVLILDRTVREQRKAAIKALRSGESYSPEPDEDPEEEDEAASS